MPAVCFLGAGACNLPHRRSQTHIRCVELDVVESVDEVGAELQAEPLRNQEVLMQAEIDIGKWGERNDPSCGAQLPKLPTAGG